MKIYILIISAFAVARAAQQQYTTPVPILKQINKHNEDGSYSYGYEAADGTYKIETKYPNGEVFGKYGFTDDQGKLRTVEYGASRRGFEPTGSEIQVAPPTLKSNNYNARPLGPDEEDDGQYREDPSVYYQNDPYARSRTQSAYPQSVYSPQNQYAAFDRNDNFNLDNFGINTKPAAYRPPAYRPQPAYQPAYRPQPAYQPAYRPQPQPQPQPAYQPAFRPQPNYNFQQPTYHSPAPPAYPNYHQFQGHPATNVDLWTGSYTVNYRR